MDRAAAFKVFQETAAEVLDLDPVEIVPGASMRDDLDVDSLAFVELSLALEEAFDVKIPEPEPDDVQTVQGAFDHVAALLELDD